MSDTFGAIASLIGSGINAATNAGIASGQQQLTQDQLDYLMQHLSKIEGINAPQFNTNLPPPEQLALEKYGSPILAQSSQVNISPQDRQAQMDALNRLQGVASGASNSEMNAAAYKAMANAAQQQKGANDAITQQLAARGTLGSGLELAAKQQAAQNAANNSQSGMLQAAQNNALQRLQAQGSYLQGTGQLRGQDTALAEKNADIINQFNLANTGLRNQVNQMNTNVANQQSLYNTGQNNAYQRALLQLQNQGAQQTFQDKLGQAEAAAGEANNISNTAINAGNTQGALQANTASAIGQGIGNFANMMSGAWGKNSGSGNSSSGTGNTDNTNASGYDENGDAYYNV